MQFQIQRPGEPLYPDVIWGRPENRQMAGKLLMIGGGGGDLNVASMAYAQAMQAGIGTLRLLVPSSLAKITKDIPGVEYAPSTQAGSFSAKSLAEMLDISRSVDGVMLAGDLSKNSETSLTLEKFLNKYDGLAVVSWDAIESVQGTLIDLLDRPQTIIFLKQRELRELAIKLRSPIAVTSDMPTNKFVELVELIAKPHQAIMALERDDDLWIIDQTNIVECKQSKSSPATAATWALQQPEKLFQAIVTSAS